MKWEEIPQIDLYSDGGAEPNPGKGGFGVIMSYKGNRKEFSQGFILTTNNRMELMGVIYGLERLKTKSIVNIYTDSQYVINGIEKGWAANWKSKNWMRTKNSKAINHDLWARLLDLISSHEVKFNWVKGHAGHEQNERCDVLAYQALISDELLEDVGYEPKEDLSEADEVANTRQYSKNGKVENEGDSCKKCGTKVVKKQPKKKHRKPDQTYYYEYIFSCPNCKTIYLTEEAKKYIVNDDIKLFD